MFAQPKTIALTALAMLGFAGNSLLCRMALDVQVIDPVTFTSARLVSGALVLLALARFSGRFDVREGSMAGALALFAYAIMFSLAYVKLSTGTGALILFGCVQLTMFGASVWRGDAPRAREWLGLAVAFGGLIALLLPGVTAPDPLGALAMAAAGLGWGVYSLLGRGSASPLATTAGNFLRSAPLALLSSGLAFNAAHATPTGLALAVASGALASGVGYSLWYAVLPQLSSARAAIVQLTVPLIAALSGVVWLGEAITLRLGVAAAAILGGVLIALRRPSSATGS